MATPQVFIVDEISFPLHLQYRFAGTTAGEGKEKNISLLADISRVRPGDPVIFYQVGHGFYGIFQISETHEHPFWERKYGWLQDELRLPKKGRPLIYRVLIEPLQVYKRPVNEWEAIDRLPLYARDVRWSLFYRKLKGERGCSYMFPHEYEGLKELIELANPEGPIAVPGEPGELSWEDGEIRVRRDVPKRAYGGSRASPFSHINLKGAEIHLQAWFAWHIGKEPDMEPICGNPVWFANEYFTGSGMQKGDILCVLVSGSNREFRLVELKVVESKAEHLEQFRRYIQWVKDYVWREGDIIQPIWVSKGFQKLGEAKKKAKKIADEEGCRELQLYRWELVGNQPSFIPLHLP